MTHRSSSSSPSSPPRFTKFPHWSRRPRRSRIPRAHSLHVHGPLTHAVPQRHGRFFPPKGRRRSSLLLSLSSYGRVTEHQKRGGGSRSHGAQGGGANSHGAQGRGAQFTERHKNKGGCIRFLLLGRRSYIVTYITLSLALCLSSSLLGFSFFFSFHLPASSRAGQVSLGLVWCDKIGVRGCDSRE
jgi:hypothetical protein